MIIDIIPVLLLVVLCFGAKPIKPITDIDETYLSYETEKYYRGLFSVVVLLHHMAQHSTDGFLFRYFSLVGYLAVAVFFFYSGYGLMKSYTTKGEVYRKNFFKKRLPAILIPYLFVTLIYWGMSFITGKGYSPKEVFLMFTQGSLIVNGSWYIIAIFIFYIAFGILMKICQKHYYRIVIGCGVCYVVYLICCILLNFGAYWYKTSHMLVIGMLWALNESKITAFIKKNIVVFPVIWIAFLVVFITKSRNYIPSKSIVLLTDIVCSLLFAISVLLFSTKVRIGNKMLSVLGDISLETYLIHGFIIRFFRSNVINISNDFLWAVVSIAASLISGYILHAFFSWILSQYKKRCLKS